MRVWDVHPGYLDRARLLAEHREIHGLLSVIRNAKRGYSRHPETLRWKEHLGALVLRHDQVAAEMEVRGYAHRTPGQEAGAALWPESFLASPGEQLRMLKGKLGDRQGRISLPRGGQELWAQHEYSALARDPELCRELGARVAGLGGGNLPDALVLELSVLLRRRPPEGALRNALEHLWGHVSRWLEPEDRQPPREPRVLLREVVRLSSVHGEVYLLASTALSDLAVWL